MALRALLRDAEPIFVPSTGEIQRRETQPAAAAMPQYWKKTLLAAREQPIDQRDNVHFLAKREVNADTFGAAGKIGAACTARQG